MITVTSKTVLADKTSPTTGPLNNPFFYLKQRRSPFVMPGEEYYQKTDMGEPKKNQMNDSATAVGGDSRPGNQGTGFSENVNVDKHEQEHSPPISSHYDDGNRADDETRPGHGTRIKDDRGNPLTDENNNPYFAQTWAFDNPSTPFTFNEIYGKDDSMAAKQNLSRVNQSREIYPRRK